MWRLIIDTEFLQSYYSKAGQGSRRIKLECGHEIVEKASVKLPKKNQKWCKECERNPPRPGSYVAFVPHPHPDWYRRGR